ncbi:MAG: biopolymer transporter ExbD [Acidobacteriota bacterium]
MQTRALFQTAQLRSEINVTPFVDVCLVLLIIFMVITPMLVNDPGVLLPFAGHPTAVETAAKKLTLRLDRSLTLDGHPLNAGDLLAELRRLQSGHARLAIRADRRLPYREVRVLLETASQARFSGAELETELQPPH